MRRRLARNKERGRLAGVCAGLADATGIDVSLIRAGFLLTALFGVGEVVYIVLWIAVPKADRGA